MRPVSRRHSRRGLVGGSTFRRTPISRSPLDKNPMPGHLSELHPVNEVNTKGQFFRASSSDGIHWDKINKDLIESRIEEDEAQASPDVFYANGKYHMFFCYRYSSHYRAKEHGYRIGYASSVNLVDWVRDDAKAGIDVSNEGWDAEMLSYPHVFELDGKTYLAYLGNQVGRYGFGLAVLDGTLEEKTGAMKWKKLGKIFDPI